MSDGVGKSFPTAHTLVEDKGVTAESSPTRPLPVPPRGAAEDPSTNPAPDETTTREHTSAQRRSDLTAPRRNPPERTSCADPIIVATAVHTEGWSDGSAHAPSDRPAGDPRRLRAAPGRGG